MSALAALIFVFDASAQPRRPVNDKVAPLSKREAAERWAEFSSAKLADYCMSFSISHNPRRGESVFYDGLIFGSERDGAALTRIRIKKSGDPSAKFADFILKNTPRGSEIFTAENGKWKKIPESEWFKPMLGGLVYSPFDILMPYRFWEARYDSAGRIGQAVYFFALAAPEGFKGGVSKVVLALTRDFNAPAQTEIFGGDGKLVKTVSLGSVKKVDGLWIMRESSARDELSRDKDILRFRAAKLRAALPASVFSTDAAPTAPETPELKAL